MPPRLDGRTVVVTRGPGGADALSARLAELGAVVRPLPAIAFAPPEDPAPLAAALLALPSFAWVAFASVTAVDRTLEALAAAGLEPSALAGRALAAVGPATAARLAQVIRAPDVVPAEATGAALAAALGARVAGQRVLLPRPAEGRPELLEGLRAAGADVTAVVAYRTVPAPPENLRPLGTWLRDGAVDAVAFASPSAVEAVVTALGPEAGLLDRAVLAAIGPTTASALSGVGLRAEVVPDRHTGQDLAEAIAERLGRG